PAEHPVGQQRHPRAVVGRLRHRAGRDRLEHKLWIPLHARLRVPARRHQERERRAPRRLVVAAVRAEADHGAILCRCLACGMEYQARPPSQSLVVIRRLVALRVGVVVMVLVAVTTGGWRYAPTLGWIAAACVYLGWTWTVVLPMDADQTREHVAPEDPPRGW